MIITLIKMGVLYTLVSILFWISFILAPVMGRLEVGLLTVLLYRQSYGLSPEEETQHAQLWACLVVLAFALGLAWR